MGLRFSRPGPNDWNSNAWWDRLFRGQRIEPDDESVSTDKLQDEAVTNAKLRDSAGHSVIGRTAAAPGSPADIAAGAERYVLVRRPGGVVFDAIADADLPSTIARDTEVTAAISAHEAELDPHPQYSTATELAAAITTHEGLADPHTGYALETSGTYTATLTGCTTSPTVTVYWTKNGQVVTLFAASLHATSNTTAATLTGAPANIRPTRDQGFSVVVVQDNSVVQLGLARMLTTGTIDLRPSALVAGSWTAANDKGVDYFNLTYSLD